MEENKNQEEFVKAIQDLSAMNKQIKESVDFALQTGELTKEDDFYKNDSGEEIIEIEDQNNNIIVFNYTKGIVENLKKV